MLYIRNNLCSSSPLLTWSYVSPPECFFTSTSFSYNSPISSWCLFPYKKIMAGVLWYFMPLLHPSILSWVQLRCFWFFHSQRHCGVHHCEKKWVLLRSKRPKNGCKKNKKKVVKHFRRWEEKNASHEGEDSTFLCSHSLPSLDSNQGRDCTGWSPIRGEKDVYKKKKTMMNTLCGGGFHSLSIPWTHFRKKKYLGIFMPLPIFMANNYRQELQFATFACKLSHFYFLHIHSHHIFHSFSSFWLRLWLFSIMPSFLFFLSILSFFISLSCFHW